jgi:hypothetical protein
MRGRRRVRDARRGPPSRSSPAFQGGAGKRVTAVSRNRRALRTDRDGVPRGTIGRDAVHVAIDDATRLAHAEVLSDEKATAVGFLSRASRSTHDTASPSRVS